MKMIGAACIGGKIDGPVDVGSIESALTTTPVVKGDTAMADSNLTVHRTYVFRLYPTKAQASVLERVQ
jgi:hypothetical protein